MRQRCFKQQHDYTTHIKEWRTLSFSDYCRQHSDIIATTRGNTGMISDNETITWNSPYELSGNSDHAVLMIHGFLASPYYLRAIAERYHQLGFTVRNITLAGHGTCPGDLLNTKAQHWQQQVEHAITQLQQEFRHIHLCGYSLGGALACLANTKHEIVSIMQIASAHQLHWHLRRIFDLAYPATVKSLPGLRWAKRTHENHRVCYHSIPNSICHQVHTVVKQVRRAYQNDTCTTPTFITGTAEDSTIDARGNLWFWWRSHHFRSQLYWYQRRHLINHTHNVTVIETTQDLPKNVLEMSHIGLPIAADDPYLGLHGSYHQKPARYWGENKVKHKSLPGFRRLTYNPDFESMAAKMEQFLRGVVK